MVKSLDSAGAVEFADEVLARLDGLQDVGIGHPSIFRGS